MADITDPSDFEIGRRAGREPKRGFLARWLRAQPSNSRQPEASSEARSGASNKEIFAAADRRPRSEPPRTSWEEVLKQRREAAEREYRERQQVEQERSRMLWSHAASGEMGVADALEILGLRALSTEPEVRAAHEAMMNCKHPDVRNSEFLTKLVTAARDVLLQRIQRKD